MIMQLGLTLNEPTCSRTGKPVANCECGGHGINSGANVVNVSDKTEQQGLGVLTERLQALNSGQVTAADTRLADQLGVTADHTTEYAKWLNQLKAKLADLLKKYGGEEYAHLVSRIGIAA